MNSVEIQHLSEHETLQILQRHALNGKHEEFFELLKTIDGEDKKRDITELCNMQGVNAVSYTHLTLPTILLV